MTEDEIAYELGRLVGQAIPFLCSALCCGLVALGIPGGFILYRRSIPTPPDPSSGADASLDGDEQKR